MVLSTCLKLLIFLPAILTPSCASSSPAFHMMHSAYRLNKQSGNIQPCTPFPVCCSTSSSNCCFFTCIQISQEAGQAVWYSLLFKNFPQFVVIHTFKGFCVVNKAEADVFLELSCFLDDPTVWLIRGLEFSVLLSSLCWRERPWRLRPIINSQWVNQSYIVTQLRDWACVCAHTHTALGNENTIKTLTNRAHRASGLVNTWGFGENGTHEEVWKLQDLSPCFVLCVSFNWLFLSYILSQLTSDWSSKQWATVAN